MASTSDVAALPEFDVYPNPTNGDVTIAVDAVNESTVSVVNMNGQEVQTHALSGGVQEIQLRNLLPGAYFVQLHYGAYKMTKKLVVLDQP